MEFLKRNIWLILIFSLSIFLRVNYDTFLSGYNFDELAIVSISKGNFPFEILYNVARLDYHAPLYYLIAHFFTYFSNEWLYLRLFNIFLSILNILVFYKIGLLLKNKTTGLLLALILCVNHIQISISNFIKFYCLCFLLLSLIIYYFVDIIKNNQNYIKLGLMNLLYILSSTLGIFFVIFEYIILLLFKKNKEVLKSFLISLSGFIFYFPILILQYKANLSGIFSPHGEYPSLSFFGIWTFFNDYFSPLINYSVNVPTVEANPLLIRFIKIFLESKTIDYIDIVPFILLSFIPVMFAFTGILLSLKNKINICLFILATSFLVFSFVLIRLEIIGFIPLYIYPSGLIFIILTVIGLIRIKKAGIILIFYIVLSHLVVTNVYPPEKREATNKIFCNTGDFFNSIDNSTPIILIDGGRFIKEYHKEKNIFPIDYEELGVSHSRKYFEMIFGKELSTKVKV